ncbi:hypothetical protein SDC9_129603 [bioreactor metagenome]|uniref:Uncharacterized protein n=1 Tax=bioreactor metagenome TaxID=1076179 RepID=A0A645D186_9ZZZZ
MRRAAGAEIRVLNGDDANRRDKPLRVLTQRQQLDFLLRFVERGGHGQIAPDIGVREVFRLGDLLARERLIEVDGCVVEREVKADVRGREQMVKRKRKQVLARVLLHKVEPTRPVQRNRNLTAHRQRAIHAMVDFAVLLAYVEHVRFADGSGVGRLATALRKEHGLVEHDVESILDGGASGDDGGVLLQVAVQIIQAFRHVQISGFLMLNNPKLLE